jgi:hypothetical protein
MKRATTYSPGEWAPRRLRRGRPESEPQRGGQVAIRSTTGGGFTDRETHLSGEPRCTLEEFDAVFALERSSIESSAYLQFRSGQDGPKIAQASFDSLHVRNA